MVEEESQLLPSCPLTFICVHVHPFQYNKNLKNSVLSRLSELLEAAIVGAWNVEVQLFLLFSDSQ